MEMKQNVAGPAALVVAHPGHELRAYSWLLSSHPRVFVLTDGSGHVGKSRLDSTTKILDRAGAKAGNIYGRLTDREIYSAIMNHESGLFIGFVEELAETLIREQIDCVVGDAMEGYNPAHDVCRLIINAAVEIASGAREHSISNFDILLTGAPSDYPDESFAGAMWLHLEDAVASQKLELVRAYSELSDDVNKILGREGMEAIRTECLRPVPCCVIEQPVASQPYYEIYGEERVAAGFYNKVLRYREHVLPLAQALRQHLDNRDRWTACAS